MRSLIVIAFVLVSCQREKEKAADPAPAPAPEPTPAPTPSPTPPSPTPAPPDTPTPGVTAEYKAAITNLCNAVDAAKADPAWKDGDRATSLRLVTTYVQKARQAVTDPTAKKELAALDNMPDVNRFIPILDSLADRAGVKTCGFTAFLKDAIAQKAAQQPPAKTP